jgi:hypothetical protein
MTDASDEWPTDPRRAIARRLATRTIREPARKLLRQGWSSGQSGEGKQAQARPSFLKKRSKKLLPVLASAFADGLSPDNQKFFGSRQAGAAFFSKKTLSSFTRLPWD